MNQSTTAQPKNWVFQEAYALKQRFESGQCRNDYVLFETGYGPSGLPHIGTFGEVARTTMVMRALQEISGIPVKLICFSDDMDGLRKVPDNIPNPDLVTQYLDQPLSAVPDPFGTHESYGDHMNHRLKDFLDRFGFAYEFYSATDCYQNGTFDDVLRLAVTRYDDIMDVMLPTLGADRQRTYSPFLPISSTTGKVLYVPMKAVNAQDSTITFEEDGQDVTMSVTGGQCKLQWKPDFGMRWAALGVDFEMYGKDHLVNGKIYSAICKILGGTPPQQYHYELFLDKDGQKISKSKGNGISLEEWLAYAPQESLALYMFQSPKKAKRLHFDVIPKAVDEYVTFVGKYHEQEDTVKQMDNPVWAIHGGNVPALGQADISFSLLLNLASACNPEDKAVLWGFIKRYIPQATPESHGFLYELAGYAVRYYEDFIKPHKQFRSPEAHERDALRELLESLQGDMAGEQQSSTLQDEIYRIGREHGFDPMRSWFSCLYEVLLGQTQGPRMGSFIALYGTQETAALIEEALRR